MCEILGFKDINRTLLDQVKKAYKCHLASLVEGLVSGPGLDYNRGRAVYISEPGLYQLELATVLPIGCSPLGSSSLLG